MSLALYALVGTCACASLLAAIVAAWREQISLSLSHTFGFVALSAVMFVLERMP